MPPTITTCSLETVSLWPFTKKHSATHPDSELSSVTNMSTEPPSAPSSLSSISRDMYEKRKKERELISSTSTESEGPIIVINDTSSESEESSTVSFSTDESSQKLGLVALSDYDSIQSSGSAFTSEGGESEVEKRPLTPSTTAELIDFLEKSLSDDGLSQDLFLLKHVRRHCHGFVSLKLLAGYKQAKKLNCTWHSLSVAAMQSVHLEVNADGRKVRRIAPLPENLLHVPPSRVLAAVDVPDSLMTMEGLAATFSKFGNLASLHLVKPKSGGGVPDALQALVARVPEVCHTNCALIQYDDVWGVAKALKEFSDPKISLHVLYNRRKSTRSPASSTHTITPTPPHYHSPHHPPNNKRKEHLQSEWRRRITNEYRRDSTGSETEEGEIRRRMGSFENRRVRTSYPNLGGLNRSSYLPQSLPASPQMIRKNEDPKPLRKNSVPAAIYRPNATPETVRKYITAGKTDKAGILRVPKGPDGTKGFISSPR